MGGVRGPSLVHYPKEEGRKGRRKKEKEEGRRKEKEERQGVKSRGKQID